ncbi:MAG: class I SAM-dependent methyltransferase [Alphaproteobacteria bacterium]
MGFYSEYVVPFAIHLVMKNKEAMRWRQLIVPRAQGRVLEIGIGSGLNLPFYSVEARELCGVEPSRRLIGMARHAASCAAPRVEFLNGTAEMLPYEDASFDTVVSTWTLCSIPQVDRALAEVRRVLKPGGRFLFIEHGCARDAGVRRWQDRLNPAWRAFSGGCNLNRDIVALLKAAGFEVASLESGYLLKGPRTHTFTYAGEAA